MTDHGNTSACCVNEPLGALEYKRLKLATRMSGLEAGAEPSTFKGYGAIFGNKDRDGDIVVRGAFKDSLQSHVPKLLWQHNTKEPIGRFDVIREDAKGLWVEGRLASEGKGAEVYELLKMGALDGLSIGFVAKEASRDPSGGTRTIRRAELMEVSVVTFPANDQARIMDVKSTSSTDASDTSISPPETKRGFEQMLRRNGFSRGQAKTITTKGFHPEVLENPSDIASLIKHIADLTSKLSAPQA